MPHKWIIGVVVVGPSSSHTVGPMRAGKIFIADLQELKLLEKVRLSFLRSPFLYANHHFRSRVLKLHCKFRALIKLAQIRIIETLDCADMEA